jgi:hypothetical protein
MRPHRVHDSRQTLISLSLADGRAQGHAPQGDARGSRGTSWTSTRRSRGPLCGDVAKLRLTYRFATPLLQSAARAGNPEDFQPFDGPLRMLEAGVEPALDGF